MNKENERMKEQLQLYDPGIAMKFWEITRTEGDLFYINIASDIVAGKRKIRGARENAREWAEIFKESLRRKFYDDQQQESEIENYINDSFIMETEVEVATGVRHPKAGHIANLYDLVLEQCKKLQDNLILVEFLEKAERLTRISHWPKSDNLTGYGFILKFDEPLLGPLALNLVVCNRLNDDFRKEAIDNGDAIVDAFMGRSDRSELDEYQLEDLLTSGLKGNNLIYFKAKKIPTSYMDPSLAYVIKNAQINPVFKTVLKPKCLKREIEIMKDIHEFMLKKSNQYRNLESKLLVVRILIDGHWRYAIDCIKQEVDHLGERLDDDELQSLEKMGKEFWKITSSTRDVYFLGIVSDIVAKRRKVRDGRDSPRNWAEIFKNLLQQEMNESQDLGGQTNQQIFTTQVNNLLKKEIHVDDATGMRYSRKGYIGDLYDRLIGRRCRDFQDKREIVRSLKHVANLARLTQWPKKGRREEGLFTIEFDEHTIGPLTLGLLVCNELGEQYREVAVENEVSIFDALTIGIFDSTPTDSVSLLFLRDSILNVCERSQSLVEILETACNPKKDPRLKILCEQMAQLKPIAERAPHRFFCKEEEIEKIELLFHSITRLLSVDTDDNKCFEHIVRLMAQLEEQFVDKCLRSVVTSLGGLADDQTKRHVLLMPKFLLIIGRESLPSLKDCLIFAGSILNGIQQNLVLSTDMKVWQPIFEETTRDMLREPPEYLPTGLKEHWMQARKQSPLGIELNDRLHRRLQLYSKRIYNDLIIGWCNIFEPHTTHLQSEYIKGVERVVEVASSLVRLAQGKEYFANLDVEPEDEFLLGQSVLGYSVCVNLDPMFNVEVPRTLRPFSNRKFKKTHPEDASSEKKLKRKMRSK